MTGKKVLVIPCSGIGKPIGTVSRETAYEIKKQRPDIVETVCLAALTSGDEETIKKLNKNFVTFKIFNLYFNKPPIAIRIRIN